MTAGRIALVVAGSVLMLGCGSDTDAETSVSTTAVPDVTAPVTEAPTTTGAHPLELFEVSDALAADAALRDLELAADISTMSNQTTVTVTGAQLDPATSLAACRAIEPVVRSRIPDATIVVGRDDAELLVHSISTGLCTAVR